MGGPAGCYSSRTCISLRLHGEGCTGRVGSGGKAGRRLSEVCSKTGSLGTWPRLSNIGSVSVQTQLRPLVCEATVALLDSHMNTADVGAPAIRRRRNPAFLHSGRRLGTVCERRRVIPEPASQVQPLFRGYLTNQASCTHSLS